MDNSTNCRYRITTKKNARALNHSLDTETPPKRSWDSC